MCDDPDSQSKLQKEVKILENLRGGVNIIDLKSVIEDPATQTQALVFEFVNGSDLRELYHSLSDHDTRHYIYQVLKALDYCHSMGIMHRDIKARNVMVDDKTKTVRLIDFGLAEFYHPGLATNKYFSSPLH